MNSVLLKEYKAAKDLLCKILGADKEGLFCLLEAMTNFDVEPSFIEGYQITAGEDYNSFFEWMYIAALESEGVESGELIENDVILIENNTLSIYGQQVNNLEELRRVCKLTGLITR